MFLELKMKARVNPWYVKMEIIWKLGKIKRVKWQFIGQIRQHSMKKEKRPKGNISGVEQNAFYMHCLIMCGISTFFKSLNQRNIKLFYFLLNLTKVLFKASVNTNFAYVQLAILAINTSILHKNYIHLKPAMSLLRILWLLFLVTSVLMHVGSLEAAAVSNKDLFLQKVAFRQLQWRENTLSFKAKFSLVVIFLHHLKEVLVHCYVGVLLKDLEGKITINLCSIL